MGPAKINSIGAGSGTDDQYAPLTAGFNFNDIRSQPVKDVVPRYYSRYDFVIGPAFLASKWRGKSKPRLPGSLIKLFLSMG